MGRAYELDGGDLDNPTIRQSKPIWQPRKWGCLFVCPRPTGTALARPRNTRAMPDPSSPDTTDHDERKAKRKARAAANMRAWRAANAEEIKAKAAAYHAANREKENARARAYHAANRETLNAKQAAYRVANAEKLKAQIVAYRAGNRETIRAKQAARRAAAKLRQQGE
jgi:hypothetical protein